MSDLLNSAFDEDAGVDPDRDALGSTLDEIDIKSIRTMAHKIAATFTQQMPTQVFK